MWHFDPAKNRFRATLLQDRVLDVERGARGWDLWYRRANPPHRALRVGANLPSAAMAKQVGADLAITLTNIRSKP